MAALLERLCAVGGGVAGLHATVRLLDVPTALTLRPDELRQAGDLAGRLRRLGHSDRRIRLVLRVVFCEGREEEGKKAGHDVEGLSAQDC